MVGKVGVLFRLLLVFGLVFSSFPPFIYGEKQEGTMVSGELKEDTVWTKEGSPYKLIGNVTIPPGVTLTVEPGAEVVGYIGAWINANGKFIAIGTKEQRISLDTAYVKGLNASGSIVHIENADVRRGGNGGYLASGANLYLKNNTFINGSVLTLAPNTTEPVIMNNVFLERATVNLSLGSVDTIIENNTFLNLQSSSSTDISISCSTACTGPNLVLKGNNFFGLNHAYINLQSNKVLQFEGTNNYWGTTELAKINQFIIDANDNSNYRGYLVVEPFAFKPFDHEHPIGELAAPLVHSVGDNQQIVTGLTDADSEVEVWNSDELIGTSQSLADGTFSVSVPVQVAGTMLTIIANDSFNRQSVAAVTTVADVTPPDVPIVHVVTDALEYVTGEAEPYSIVTVFKDGAFFKEESANEQGEFRIFIGKQRAETILGLQAKDLAGNKSEMVTVTVLDVTPPPQPTLNEDVTESSDFISGRAEPAAMVFVKANGVELFRQRADMFGQFGTFIAKQKAGTTIEIMAEDAAGNKSEPLIVQVKDNTPPNLFVYRIGDNTDKLYGVTEIGAEVSVKKDGKVIGQTVVSGNTEFSVNIGRQTAGTKLVVTSKDKAGNVTTLEVEVVDLTPPSKPKVDEVTDQSKSVNGKAEAGSTVEVFRGSTRVGSARTSDSGTFSVTIAIQKAGTVLTVKAKDTAGNESSHASVTVKDVTPPAVPQVNTVTNKATVVSGKTENGAIVTVKIGTKSYSAKADSSGNYKVTVPVQNAGVEVVVSAKDASGNVSGVRKVKVSRVAPNVPVVKGVSNKASTVSGSAEKKATVRVKIGTKTYSSKVDVNGNYKVTIPIQDAGASLVVTARDSAGNTSVGRTITVSRVAPNMPSVNSVYTYSTKVTGKTEKYAVVTVKIGTRTYNAKANAKGNYSVTIPKQKKGTGISVTAKDSKGNVSAARTIKVG
ncbi:Ig-like domain-containing protein [Bacillus sp. FJAT-45066]|uniref:Ig-like domain-containing protein n=1 Tax=Bacillus sp. FJAT-45066 TaxID=2011010 RepID=UPI000BB98215|nr:Ig-like domain-containing protein [Bacillus sp. FJAT-45066]